MFPTLSLHSVAPNAYNSTAQHRTQATEEPTRRGEMLMLSKIRKSCTISVKWRTRENMSLMLNGAGDPVTQDTEKAEVLMPPLP